MQHRIETAKKQKELKAEKEAKERADLEAQRSTDDFAGTADEVKLSLDNSKARVDKHPTRSKKQQKKIEARALEAGVSVEQYLAQEAAENTDEAQREAAAAVSAADVAKDPQPAISVPAEPLSDAKKEKYAARAAEKGVSVEEYIQRRAAKKAGKETAAAEEPQPGAFVVDTAGDAALAPAAPPAFVIDTAGDPAIAEAEQREAALAQGPVVWDPSMLGDHKVKDLSKAERKARVEWMRARRAARKAAAGDKGTLSKKEKAKRRMEKKTKMQDRLVAEIVAAKGKARESVTREEIREAQRKAKRTMKELKREKRNKVIHRGRKGFGEVTKGVRERLSMEERDE